MGIFALLELKILESSKDSQYIYEAVNTNLVNGVFYTHPIILLALISLTTLTYFFRGGSRELYFFKKVNYKPCIIALRIQHL